MNVRIETVHTGAFSMNYFRFGRGAKTLVILPGLSVQSVMGAADAVEAAYRPMEDAFTIYLFDRRNELPPSYSVRDMARDTAAAFRALGLKEVCLFGASRDEQYRVIDNWVRLAKNGDRVGLYLSFGEELYPPAIFAQYRETLIKTASTVTDEELKRFVTLAEGIRGFDVTDELDRIRCPVLAIGDYADRVLDADATMEIAEKLDERQDFRLYLYAGYGHAAYDTAPDYLDRVRRFLEEENR